MAFDIGTNYFCILKLSLNTDTYLCSEYLSYLCIWLIRLEIRTGRIKVDTGIPRGIDAAEADVVCKCCPDLSTMYRFSTP